MPGGGNELTEPRPILPDPSANGHETDADSHVGQDIDRALHRVRDGEVGVFTLLKTTHEKNAAAKPD